MGCLDCHSQSLQGKGLGSCQMCRRCMDLEAPCHREQVEGGPKADQRLAFVVSEEVQSKKTWRRESRMAHLHRPSYAYGWAPLVGNGTSRSRCLPSGLGHWTRSVVTHPSHFQNYNTHDRGLPQPNRLYLLFAFALPASCLVWLHRTAGVCSIFQ